jgi:WD40 repeat protein
MSSSQAIVPKTEPSSRGTKRDEITNPALEVAFVRDFSLEYRVRSVRFSADGKYLAVVVAGDTANSYGATVIYDVQTGKKLVSPYTINS